MSVAINASNFPDTCFREYLERVYSGGDSALSDSEIANIKNLTLTDNNTKKVSTIELQDEATGEVTTHTSTTYLQSLVGLDYLTALESLTLNLSYVNSIDLSQLTNLKTVDIKIATGTIDLSHNTLLEDISVNGQYRTVSTLSLGNHANLRELRLTKASIGETFDCHGNTTIQSLSFDSCPDLTTIDVSGCTSLAETVVSNMPALSSFNASGCTSLSSPRFGDCNQLTSVNISGCPVETFGLNSCRNITSFNCSGCTSLKSFVYRPSEGDQFSLETLNLSGCTALETINCRHNLITSLDVTGLSNLKFIYCEDNQITNLQLGNHPNLKELWCNDNAITSIDLSGAPIIAELVENDEPWFNRNSRNNQKLMLLFRGSYDTSTQSNDSEFEVDEGVSVTTTTGTISLPDSSQIEGVEINAENFPDAAFRDYLSANYDEDNDGYLSGREIVFINGINIPRDAMSLEGIQHFPMCTYIEAGPGISMTSLDIHGNTLIEGIQLDDCNSITSFNLTGCTGLKSIYAHGGVLHDIDVSTCTALEQLWCFNDSLTSLTFGDNPNLHELHCNENQLQSLDIHTLQNLAHLECFGNNIKQLDISGCPKLVDIFRSSTDPDLLDIRLNNNEWIGYSDSVSDIHTDYSTEILGAKAFILANPVDAVAQNGKATTYHTTASGIDLSYQWQTRNGNQASSPVITDEGEIRDVYSDRSIKIHSHSAMSDSVDILVLLADYQFEYGKKYRIKPNSVSSGSGISLHVWSSRYPPIGFGIVTNDPAENDQCVNESCNTSSASGIEFTVNNANHYFVITLRALRDVAISEQTLRPTIERYADGVYEDISYIWSYYPIWEDVSGATTNQLSLTASADKDNTQYRCKVSNNFSEAYSEPANLRVVSEPSITSHPQRQAVKDNTTVTFSIAATPDENLNNYQWQVSTDGGETWTDAENGNMVEYTITATKAMDHSLYRCVVTNIAGTKTSNSAELRVLIEPGITTQPQGTTVETAKDAAFNVTATGDELSYQWQVSTDNGNTWNNTDSADNSPTYSFHAVRSLNGNKYRCVVTNEVGSITSSAASLKVMDGPVILQDPVSVTVRDGNNASFAVNATGDELSYQWQISTDNESPWENILGATANNYSFTALFAMNGSSYRCRVYNDVAEAYSEGALLTATIQPNITTQPQDVTVASGDSASFTVEATDMEGAGLTYIWQLKTLDNNEWATVSGNRYSGMNTASLTVTAAADIDGYLFRCLIEGGHDSIISESAEIDVVTVPVITGDPQDITIRAGSSISLTASASGKYLSYQWQNVINEQWEDITGAVSETYTTVQDNTTVSGVGTAQYRCVVTNIAGSAISEAATITIVPTIIIINQPLSTESPAGGLVRFTVGASGERLKYRWQTRGRSSSVWSNVIGELYTGASTATLSVSVETALSGNQYRCIITDEYSDEYPPLAQIVTSDAATLTTSSQQVILTQPADITVAAGDLASFEVVTEGNGYAYQWQVSIDDGDTWNNVQNNGNLPVLAFTSNANQNGAKYCCVVSSTEWAVISRAATLNVATLPVITEQPQNARVGEDQNAEFTIGASGVDLHYQWQINTDDSNWIDISDDLAETDTIVVTASMQESGNKYRCKVYNIAGTVYSNTAILSVIEKIRILENPEDCAAASGDTVSFSVYASGYSLSYQWQEKAEGSEDWVNVQNESATGTTMNITASERSNGNQYRCFITNDAGEDASAPAMLTVYFMPVFTVQPQSEEVEEGSNVNLHAEASGGAISYQWQSKRENDTYWSNLLINGATTDTLPLKAHIAINGIQYRCTATNLAGTTESEAVTIQVNTTSFCLADGSEIDEGLLPAGYYTFSLNADRKGIVYDIGLYDGANTEWVVVEASSARTFYTNGRKAIKILFHHTDNADLEHYAIRPMLEEGQEAHQWASPANASYEHDAANDFNYGWFSIGNKYGDRENIVTASAPCVMTLRYRPIWKDTL